MSFIRLNILLGGLLLVCFVMVWRVLDLHISERDFLQKQGDARTVRIENISAHRGMIKDRRGKPLAVSSPVGSLWVNPRILSESGEDLGLLAKILKLDPKMLARKIESNNQKTFLYLKRYLPPETSEQISDLKLKGVNIDREFHRFYPAGEVAAHILGFTDIDDQGQEGVELAYNDWLKGDAGRKKVLKNLYGDIVKDIRPLEEARPGKELSLSIDLRVQYHAYRELKTAVQHYKAESGSIVILDVNTGEVIAMANQPAYNPNNRINMQIDHVRNRAVTDVFEPGSTVKPFTMAVGLESGALMFNSTVDTSPGFIRVDNKTIRDPHNNGILSMSEVIEKSSQVGITKIALSLDEQAVWNMFRGVGFGQSTGSGFPGESMGQLPNHLRWKPIERATFAYGYGLSVTPLQLASAYLTIASGGYRRTVSLLKSPEVQSVRVMDEKVAGQILQMLAQVVSDGTGKKALIESYTVAGKTGTVRKVGEEGYQDTHHLSFFAGITPVENPRFVAVVLINDPQVKEYGGGAIAAPIFSRIMSGALRLLNVPPNDIKGALG